MKSIKLFLALVLFCAPIMAQSSPKTDLGIYDAPPAPTLPAAGGTLVDSVFGTQIMRVSSAVLDPGICEPFYSYWPTFNSNNTRILGNCSFGPVFWVLNPSTFTLGARTIPSGGATGNLYWNGGAYWHKTDANLIYVPDLGQTLYLYNVSTNIATPFKSFSGIFPSNRQMYQVSMSDDNSVIAGTIITNNSGSQALGFFAYNLSTSTMLIYNDTTVNMNEVYISKNGRYVLVFTDSPQHMAEYDTQNGNSRQDFGYLLNNGFSHSTVKTNFAIGFTAASTSTVIKVLYGGFPSVGRTLLLNLDYTHTGTAHMSGLNDSEEWLLNSMADGPAATVSTGYTAAATSIVISSGYTAIPNGLTYLIWWNATDYLNWQDDPNREFVRYVGASGSNLTVVRGQRGTLATAKNIAGKTYKLKPSGPFHGELFLVKTDGSGSVWRFAHHQAVYTGYQTSPFANISRDGKFVAFGSNWGNSGKIDLWIASIPNSPTTGTICRWSDASPCTP